MNDETDKIHLLAQNLKLRKIACEKPYSLLLGAGASLGSGASSTAHIVETVVRELTNSEIANLPWHDKLSSFYDILDKMSPTERYVILQNHLRDLIPSQGYNFLAKLVSDGYFDLVFTTNFDMLLETAFYKVLSAPDVNVLVNGVHSEWHIVSSLTHSTPRVKIVKLHGDVNSRKFAFCPGEIFQFGSDLEKSLRNTFDDDFIVLGHSMRDNDINRCISLGDGAIWYVNPVIPTLNDWIGHVLWSRKKTPNVIDGLWGRFDPFFALLFLEIYIPDRPLTSNPYEQILLSEYHDLRGNAEFSRLSHTLANLASVYKTSYRYLASACTHCSDYFVNFLQSR